MNTLLTEVRAIRGNSKGQFFLLFFRLCQAKGGRRSVLSLVLSPVYDLVVRWGMGIDVPNTTDIGFAFNVYHGVGLVIHEDVIIGDRVTVRHCVTIGKAKADGNAPVIGNDVDIGANSVIIGDIRIGDNVTIGAGSVVVKSIPNDCVVVGNPAKIVRGKK